MKRLAFLATYTAMVSIVIVGMWMAFQLAMNDHPVMACIFVVAIDGLSHMPVVFEKKVTAGELSNSERQKVGGR